MKFAQRGALVARHFASFDGVGRAFGQIGVVRRQALPEGGLDIVLKQDRRRSKFVGKVQRGGEEVADRDVKFLFRDPRPHPSFNFGMSELADGKWGSPKN